MLVSYSSEYLYLFNIKDDGVRNIADHEAAADDADVDDEALGANDKRESGGASNANNSETMNPEIVTRRLRLRGDWSDTGPDARPENDNSGRVESGQFRPQLQANIMSRMTEVISRMLNDPRTRLGLTSHIQDTQQQGQRFISNRLDSEGILHLHRRHFLSSILMKS